MTESSPQSRRLRAIVGSNRDAVRQHNLSAVLRLLRKFGPLSRSALTQRTELNRSTISDLVTELEELGLIFESEAIGQKGVGRPSPLVSLSDDVAVFAVNPEATSTTVGVVTLSGRVVDKVRITTPESPEPEHLVELIATTIGKMRRALAPHIRIAGIGVAVPGQVRVNDGVVRLAPHLNWVEVPFASMLTNATGLPVRIDNDASLGAIAERDFGAGRGFSEIVYLFGGVGGIGGGIIHEGALFRGSAGYAGEIGHMRISDSPRSDHSALQGTLEALVQRGDLLASLGLASAEDEELVERVKGSISTKTKKILETQIDYLAVAIGNVLNIFNPEVVLLAGYPTVLFAYDADRLMSRVRWNSLNAPQDRLLIRSAELGSNLLMIGAAGLAFGPLISRPAAYPLLQAIA